MRLNETFDDRRYYARGADRQGRMLLSEDGTRGEASREAEKMLRAGYTEVVVQERMR